MEQFCDLHTHSVFSDGTLTPSELIEQAVSLGLGAVALCDHNTVDGLREWRAAAQERPIEAIAGAEFSVDYEGRELHLLGLFIKDTYIDEIKRLMAASEQSKEESNRRLIAALFDVGISLDYEVMKKKTPNGKLNRAHFAAEMVSLGYVSSVEDAFARYLSASRGLYSPPARISVWEMLDIILRIGAVPILAHPLLSLSREELLAFLPRAKEKGLVGMECAYSTNSEEETAFSMEVCRELGLLPSGGSDFHGENKPDIALGIGWGTLAVPFAWASALRRCAR